MRATLYQTSVLMSKASTMLVVLWASGRAKVCPHSRVRAYVRVAIQSSKRMSVERGWANEKDEIRESERESDDDEREVSLLAAVGVYEHVRGHAQRRRIDRLPTYCQPSQSHCWFWLFWLFW